MMNDQPVTAFAAVVYTPNTHDRMALQKFVAGLKKGGLRVGGLLQEAIFDAEGVIQGLNAVDVASGQRIPISRPVQRDDECGLDVSALVETSDILRQAISNRPALMAVEKFGEHEQNGGGLMDEIMQTIAEGIPLLVAVPEAALPLWQELTGELGDVLDFSESALEQWWLSVSARAK